MRAECQGRRRPPLPLDTPQRQVEKLRRRRVVGKRPRVRTTHRTVLFRLSIAFVVYTARRIGSENAKNGTTCSHADRQLRAIPGYFSP